MSAQQAPSNASRKTAEDFPHLQDVLGQLVSLKTYIVIACGFRPQGSTEEVTEALEKAAGKLIKAFPWVAGHVVYQGRGPGKTGLATIVPYPPGEKNTPVIVRDATKASASLDDMLEAGVPMQLLDGDVLAVRRGLPDAYDETKEAAPVLVIQANIVEGGLVLVFQGNHHAMDMNGLSHIMRLFSRALRDQPFSDADVKHGNRERHNVVRILGPDDDKADISKLMVRKPPAGGSRASTAVPDVRWVYLHFDGPRLADLKAAALASDATEAAPKQCLSTDDALSAFLAQRITAARLKRRQQKQPHVTFSRAVDGRRYLAPRVPKEYVGHMVMCAYTTVPLDAPTATTDVGALARQMRADVLGLTANDIESVATALQGTDDKGALSYGAPLDMAGWDLVLSSFAGTGVHQLDFGPVVGGRPLFAKRPRFGPIEGLLYLMPKTVDGDVDVACCLRGEDIQTLRDDVEFLKYGSYVG